jgi:hypothetical protein
MFLIFSIAIVSMSVAYISYSLLVIFFFLPVRFFFSYLSVFLSVAVELDYVAQRPDGSWPSLPLPSHPLLLRLSALVIFSFLFWLPVSWRLFFFCDHQATQWEGW